MQCLIPIPYAPSKTFPASLVSSVAVRNGSVNKVEFLWPILKNWLGPTRLRDCSLLHIVLSLQQ